MTIRLAQFQPSLKGDQRPKGIQVERGSEDVLLCLNATSPPTTKKRSKTAWAVIKRVEDGKVVAGGEFPETKFLFYSERGGNKFFIFGTDDVHNRGGSDSISGSGMRPIRSESGRSAEVDHIFQYPVRIRLWGAR